MACCLFMLRVCVAMWLLMWAVHEVRSSPTVAVVCDQSFCSDPSPWMEDLTLHLGVVVSSVFPTVQTRYFRSDAVSVSVFETQTVIFVLWFGPVTSTLTQLASSYPSANFSTVAIFNTDQSITTSSVVGLSSNMELVTVPYVNVGYEGGSAASVLTSNKIIGIIHDGTAQYSILGVRSSIKQLCSTCSLLEFQLGSAWYRLPADWERAADMVATADVVVIAMWMPTAFTTYFDAVCHQTLRNPTVITICTGAPCEAVSSTLVLTSACFSSMDLLGGLFASLGRTSTFTEGTRQVSHSWVSPTITTYPNGSISSTLSTIPTARAVSALNTLGIQVKLVSWGVSIPDVVSPLSDFSLSGNLPFFPLTPATTGLAVLQDFISRGDTTSCSVGDTFVIFANDFSAALRLNLQNPLAAETPISMDRSTYLTINATDANTYSPFLERIPRADAWLNTTTISSTKGDVSLRGLSCFTLYQSDGSVDFLIDGGGVVSANGGATAVNNNHFVVSLRCHEPLLTSECTYMITSNVTSLVDQWLIVQPPVAPSNVNDNNTVDSNSTADTTSYTEVSSSLSIDSKLRSAVQSFPSSDRSVVISTNGTYLTLIITSTLEYIGSFMLDTYTYAHLDVTDIASIETLSQGTSVLDSVQWVDDLPGFVALVPTLGIVMQLDGETVHNITASPDSFLFSSAPSWKVLVDHIPSIADIQSEVATSYVVDTSSYSPSIVNQCLFYNKALHRYVLVLQASVYGTAASSTTQTSKYMFLIAALYHYSPSQSKWIFQYHSQLNAQLTGTIHAFDCYVSPGLGGSVILASSLDASLATLVFYPTSPPSCDPQKGEVLSVDGRTCTMCSSGEAVSTDGFCVASSRAAPGLSRSSIILIAVLCGAFFVTSVVIAVVWSVRSFTSKASRWQRLLEGTRRADHAPLPGLMGILVVSVSDSDFLGGFRNQHRATSELARNPLTGRTVDVTERLSMASSEQAVGMGNDGVETLDDDAEAVEKATRRMHALLDRFRECLSNSVAANACYMSEFRGDSACVVASKAADAACVAVEIAYAMAVMDPPVRLSIGLHFDELARAQEGNAKSFVFTGTAMRVTRRLATASKNSSVVMSSKYEAEIGDAVLKHLGMVRGQTGLVRVDGHTVTMREMTIERVNEWFASDDKDASPELAAKRRQKVARMKQRTSRRPNPPNPPSTPGTSESPVTPSPTATTTPAMHAGVPPAEASQQRKVELRNMSTNSSSTSDNEQGVAVGFNAVSNRQQLKQQQQLQSSTNAFQQPLQSSSNTSNNNPIPAASTSASLPPLEQAGVQGCASLYRSQPHWSHTDSAGSGVGFVVEHVPEGLVEAATTVDNNVGFELAPSAAGFTNLESARPPVVFTPRANREEHAYEADRTSMATSSDCVPEEGERAAAFHLVEGDSGLGQHSTLSNDQTATVTLTIAPPIDDNGHQRDTRLLVDPLPKTMSSFSMLSSVLGAGAGVAVTVSAAAIPSDSAPLREPSASDEAVDGGPVNRLPTVFQVCDSNAAAEMSGLQHSVVPPPVRLPPATTSSKGARIHNSANGNASSSPAASRSRVHNANSLSKTSVLNSVQMDTLVNIAVAVCRVLLTNLTSDRKGQEAYEVIALKQHLPIGTGSSSMISGASRGRPTIASALTPAVYRILAHRLIGMSAESLLEDVKQFAAPQNPSSTGEESTLGGKSGMWWRADGLATSQSNLLMFPAAATNSAVGPQSAVAGDLSVSEDSGNEASAPLVSSTSEPQTMSTSLVHGRPTLPPPMTQVRPLPLQQRQPPQSQSSVGPGGASSTSSPKHNDIHHTLESCATVPGIAPLEAQRSSEARIFDDGAGVSGTTSSSDGHPMPTTINGPLATDIFGNRKPPLNNRQLPPPSTSSPMAATSSPSTTAATASPGSGGSPVVVTSPGMRIAGQQSGNSLQTFTLPVTDGAVLAAKAQHTAGRATMNS